MRLRLSESLTTNGRFSRRQFAFFFFIPHIITYSLFELSVTVHDVFLVIALLWCLFQICVVIIAGIRRLHDLNHSGWYLLLAFLPIANVVMILYLLFMPGKNASGVEEVTSLAQQHSNELQDFWDSTSPEEAAGLMIAFLDELRGKYPAELSVLNPEKLPNELSDSVKDGIRLAYGAGFMRAKGWITEEQIASYTKTLGKKLKQELQKEFTKSNIHRKAFTGGFTTIAFRGQMDTLNVRSVKEIEKKPFNAVETRTQIDEYDQHLLGQIQKLKLYIAAQEEIAAEFMRANEAPEDIIESMREKSHKEGRMFTFDSPGNETQILNFLEEIVDEYKIYDFRAWIKKFHMFQPPGEMNVLTSNGWYMFNTCPLDNDECREYAKQWEATRMQTYTIDCIPIPVYRTYPNMELMKFMAKMFDKYGTENLLTKEHCHDKKMGSIWDDISNDYGTSGSS